jgi:multiple sugar transport system ATP-binding protein
MPRLSIVRLNKSFDSQPVLSDINFKTGDGELVVILGPSGCGKSTLLRLIAGLDTVDTGEVWIGSERVDMLPPRKRKTALVFQNYALYPHMTVEQNLAFPLKIAKMNRSMIKDKVIEIASMIGLSDRLGARPAQLSGGQRQRVALGRAIIRQPDLFLLDEPLSNLDADLRARMRRELVELQKRLGTTTVYVTHDQTEALTMADRLIVLESGKIKQIGTAGSVYDNPVDLFVASFVGTPKINLIDGEISGNQIKPFALPTDSIPAEYTSREVTIGIRPEHIFINADGNLVGEVIAVEFLGSRTLVTIEYQNFKLTSIFDSGWCKMGENVNFVINTDRLHIFNKTTGERFSS